MTKEEALKWCEEVEADLLEDFGDWPEASSPEDSAATVVFRTKDMFKRKLSEAASSAGISMNEYIQRSLERSVAA